MAQGLQLSQRLTQSLVLAPQLQQSLALLQAPTLELKALVEQELQQIPVLEESATQETEITEKEAPESDKETDKDAEEPEPTETAESPDSESDFDSPADKTESEGEREPADDFEAEFERLVQLDQEWRDHFSQTNLPIKSSAEEEEKRQFMFDSLVVGTSLQETLLTQVRESALPEVEWPIAEMLIGNIDEYGYLKASVEELAGSTGVPQDKFLGVLKVIQSFDPAGVGARDLRECLLLQLERSGQRSTLEYRIVDEFMDALGKRRIPEIARGTGQSVDDVQGALEPIARLEPRPGRAYLPDNDQYILPEVFVHRSGDEYVVSTRSEEHTSEL